MMRLKLALSAFDKTTFLGRFDLRLLAIAQTTSDNIVDVNCEVFLTEPGWSNHLPV